MGEDAKETTIDRMMRECEENPCLTEIADAVDNLYAVIRKHFGDELYLTHILTSRSLKANGVSADNLDHVLTMHGVVSMTTPENLLGMPKNVQRELGLI